MANESTISSTINDLLNRQFEIPDIKQHLLSNGYSSEQIESSLNKVIEARNSGINSHVTERQGLRGVGFIISGSLILLSILVFGNRSGDQVFTILRLVFGLLLLVFGIILATRPLKD